MEILRCENLSAGYGRKAIVSGATFSVGAGDYLAVVGPNGCGKTTLVRTVAGVLPALSGCISFARGVGRGDVGYLPQQSPVQSAFPATALEVALSGCQARRGLRPFFLSTEKKLAIDALSRFGAGSFIHVPYRDLSGGQRQRVLLARAFCAGRRMLILDEPATGLDPEAVAELYRTLEGLRLEGVAVMSVTHDLPAGTEGATHVLELGERIFFGKKSEWMEGRSGVCSVCGDCVSGSHHHHGAGCRHGFSGKDCA